MHGASTTRQTCWRVASLFLIPIAGLAAYYLGLLANSTSNHKAHAPATQVTNGLQVDERGLDLGELWETNEYAASLTLRNRGPDAVFISRFVTSCDCGGVVPESLTIPPGGTATITLQLNLTYRLPHQLGLAKRPLSVRVAPVFRKDFTPALGWEVKAVVRSRVCLSTQYLTFADMCVHEGEVASRKVRASVHVPGARLDLIHPPPPWRWLKSV